MDIFDQIINAFSTIPYVREWPEVQALFRRVVLGKPGHWLLPLRACESVGGTKQQAIPAIMAVACSHIGIVLVDDMLDADPRGEHLRAGAPAVVNMASALQSAGIAVIAHCEMDSQAKLMAMESVNEMFLSTSLGQYWDVQSAADEDAYWHMVQMKSGSFFQTTWELGALFGGAPIEVVRAIGEIGHIYGEMIQIHDDMNDCMAMPASPDWIQGRSSLPILFAQVVDYPDRSRFLELRQRISDVEALHEAQEILIKSGAVSYCIDQLLRRYRDAQTVLTSMKLVHPDKLDAILEEVIVPVWRLFDVAEKRLPELITDSERSWEKTE